jgi:spore germination protein GerM
MLVMGSGTAIAWWTWNTHFQANNSSVVQPNQESQLPTQGVPSPAHSKAEKSLQVYWLQPVGDRIKLVANPVKLAAGYSPEVLLQATINQLLSGSVTSGNTSTIPQQTKLRRLSVQEDGVHVDLSRDFTHGGGSTSMVGRIAQVLYTATSLDPTAQAWLSVEGKPLETLGGEGVVLEQPLTRDRFQREFPDFLIK